jgi:diguanylate cyclase (GGDEF)-like protein
MLKSDLKTKDIPIIFITAQTDIDYIARAFEVGGADYITKPFNGVELKARVKTQIQNISYMQEIKHKQSKLAQLSITDPLTKIYNSLYFDAQLKARELKMKPYWFIFIKLGRFEKINKLYGYYGANKLLRTFAKALNTSAPQKSVVARLHGVHFALLVKDYDKKVLKSFYDTLKTTLAKQKDLANVLEFYVIFKNVSNPDTTSLALYKEAQMTLVKLEDRGERYSFLS